MTRPRKWLAWRLVRLAHRLHNPEYLENITIATPNGRTAEIGIIGNDYGCGITHTTEIPWKISKTHETGKIDDLILEWHGPEDK